MRSKQNHIGMWMVMLFILSVSVLAPKMITFAGGINGYEAGVIAAASGTFTYEGKEYKAGSAYINSLTGYLSADAVDLNADQAERAIGMMNANIAEGVKKGYLYPVDGESEVSTEEGDSTEDGITEEDKTEETNNAPASDDKSDKKDKQKTDEKELDVWEAMSNQTEAKQRLQQRPKESEAAASVKLDGDDIIVTTKDDKEISIQRDEQIVPKNIIVVINVIGVILLAITVVCGVILFVTKCMTFKKRKSRKARRGHSKRRKIRHYTRAVMTGTTAVALLGVFLMIGVYVGLFNVDAIMQNMQSSGYFRYAYSEYIAELATEAYSNAVDGQVDVSSMEKVSTYEEFLFTIKQNSIKILNGETNIRIPDSNVTPYIYNLKESFMDIFHVGGICMILSIVLGIILMVYMDQRRERGVKHTAASVLIAAAIMIIVSAVMVVNKPYLHLYIEPDYLYLFVVECVKRCVIVVGSVTAFSIVMGMILVGVFRTLKNNRTED